MKIHRKYFLLRIITFPIKLSLQLVWNFFLSFAQSIKWLLYGSEEIIFGKEQCKDSIIDLIKQNDDLFKKIVEQEKKK